MNGWISAFFFLIMIGIANLFWKMGAHLDLNPAVYVSQGMMAGALMLLMLSRPGPLAIDTIKSPNTWLFGLLYYVVNSLTVYVLNYVDVAHMMVLTRISIPFSFAIAWIFLNRRQASWGSLVCQGVIVLGISLMALTLPVNAMGIGLLGCFLIGVLHTFRTLAVETHKPNNRTKTFEQEIRVTGIVMAVTGWSAYSVLVLLAVFQHYFEMAEMAHFLPTLGQVFSVNSLVLGSVYGIFIISLLRYLEFYSIKHIKSEYFMAVLAIAALSGMAFDWLADWLGIIPLHSREISTLMLVGMLIFIAGSISFILVGTQISKKTIKLNTNMARDRSLANHTLQYCAGDKAKAAKLLGVSQKILEVALHEDDPEKGLPAKLSQKLHNNFTKNVAFLDPLTGLMNKTHFLSLFRDVLKRGDKGVLLYLDLNKFKPVNDTHGHEAGDEVLKVIAQRLTANINRNSIISRLGGDEFAILLTNVKIGQGDEIQNRLAEKIAEPIQLEGHKQPVSVGASIGRVRFPEDGTSAEGLLNRADKKMYQQKS